MRRQTISLIGLAAFVTLVTALVLASHGTVRVVSGASPLRSSTAVMPANATPIAGSAQPAAGQVSKEENVIPPLPSNATHVPDEYLLKLAAMVNLPNAEERHIDKERWGQAVPIAERLVQAPCDCEQRNWLNHFIAMGKDALAGSDDDYYRAAGLMQKMARNDQQLADRPEFFAH